MVVILMLLWEGLQQSKRVVLIFADKANDANVVKQIDILKTDIKGVAERDMICKVMTNTATNALQYKKWNVTPTGNFTVLLIGKDGGEKLRSHQLVSLSKFFSLIDAMPMRQEEMKAKVNND